MEFEQEFYRKNHFFSSFLFLFSIFLVLSPLIGVFKEEYILLSPKRPKLLYKFVSFGLHRYSGNVFNHLRLDY